MLFGASVAGLGFIVMPVTSLEAGKKIGIANGRRGGWFSIVCASFWQTCECPFLFRHTAALPATIPNCFRKLPA